MSFWDDLETIGKGAAKVAAGIPFGDIWGVALSAKNAFEANDMADAWQQFSKPTNVSAVSGLSDIAQGAHLKAISDTGAHAFAAANLAFLGSHEGGIINPENWEEGWNRAGNEQVSPGQIVPGLVHDIANGGDQNKSLLLPRSDEQQQIKDQQEFFHNTWYGRTSSGALDAVYDWYADPLVVGGKAAAIANVARVTTRAENVSGAFDILRGTLSADEATRGEAKVATKLQGLIQGTDNMTFDQLMRHPVFKQNADAGAVASMFDEANKIADPTERFQTKADIYGVLMGDTKSMQRVATRQDQLASEMDRLVNAAEGSAKSATFNIADGGQAEIDAWNSSQQMKELYDRTDEVQAEADRLARLWGASKTDRIGGTIQENIGSAMDNSRVIDTVLVNGQASRPIRVLYGALGTRVAGHIDTMDVTKGYQDLTTMMSRDKWMTPDQRLGILTDFGKSSTKEDRAQAVWAGENAMYKAAGEAYGLKPEEVQALFKATTGVRGKWRSALTDRSFSGNTPMIIGPDGEATAYAGPWLPTQIASTVPFTDPKALEWVLQKHTQTRWIETLAKNYAPMTGPALNANQAARLNDIAETTWDGMNQFLGTLMRPWKFMALFRPAYPQRIQVDEQLRNLSVLGPMQYAMSAKQGAIDFVKNRTDIVPNPDYFEKLNSFRDESNAVDKLVQKTKKLNQSDFKQARLTELARQKTQLQSDLDVVPQYVKRGKTTESASLLKQKEEYQGIDVTPARNPDEFALVNRQLSDDGTLSRLMSDMSAADVHAAQSSPGWDILGPTDPNWEPSMLRDVNHQFRNVPSFMAAVRTNNDDLLAAWIRKNPQDWKVFRSIWSTPEEYATMLRGQVNHYLPSPELKAIVSERNLTMSDLAKHFPNAADRPPIHGARYRYDWPQNPNSVPNAMGRFANWWYKWAADVPEQVLARHPLYNQRFRDHMKQQIDLTPEDFLTTEQVNQIRNNAGKLARKDVSNTLFDLSQQSGASDTFRLFSPFFSAWEDTMRKWGRLYVNNPDKAVHAVQAWNSVNQMGMVRDSEGWLVKNGKAYDEQGNEVPEAKRGKGEYLMVPNFLGYVGLGPKDGVLKIPKSSFNIIFQGDPAWLPGPGPLVEVPVNELAKRSSLAGQVQNNPLLRYLLPYGLTNENPVEQLMPSWARQLESMRPTSDAYAQAYVQFLSAERAKYYSGQRDKLPEGQEIADMVNNLFVMRALLSSTAPVTVQPGINSKLQFYVDQFHQMRNEYYQNPKAYLAAHNNEDWEQVAYERFPDYFDLSVDLSTNTTGVYASDQAFGAAKRLAKYIAPHPEYGWAIVGPDNAGTYDPNVRNAELSQSIGQGQPDTWRTKQNPIDAIQKVEAEKGFIKYNQFMTALNLVMEKRDPSGQSTIRSKSNADLADAKAGFVQQLAAENQSWAAAYGSMDEHKEDDFIRTMFDAAKDSKELANRPDVKALKTYVEARGIVRGLLESRQKAGGSPSLGNQSNDDIAQAWSALTGALVKQNIGFERMYNRVLEHDTLNRELIGLGTQDNG